LRLSGSVIGEMRVGFGDAPIPDGDNELYILEYGELLGETVSVPGLGRFTTQECPATTKTHPETGETVEVPAKQVVKFKQAKPKAETAEASQG
jgi:hypothetical protein